MNENLQFWLYDKKSVTPWYFGKPKEPGSSDFLRSMGVIWEKEEKKKWLSLSIPTPEVEEDKNIWEKIWEWVQGAWEFLKFEAEEDDKTITSFAKFMWNLPWDTVQLAWDIISIASSPIESAKSVEAFAWSMIETWLNKAFWQDHFTSDEKRLISESVASEFQKISEDPSILRDMAVENPMDVLLTFTGWLWQAKNAAKAKWFSELANKLEKAEQITNPINIQKEAWKAIKDTSIAVKDKLFPEKPLDDLLLEVSQGKKADIPKFEKAIGSIDVEGVKTYEDLTKTFDNKIAEISKKQDDLLPSDESFDIKDLETTVWNRKANFVKDAIDDLETVWLKENDLEFLSRVDDLKAKQKLSIKDINDLARFYWSKFKEKSFNKMWDAKSSVSAARFENNRRWLKELSRDLLPDDVAKTLDAEMSNLFTAKDLSQKMADNVDTITKKVQPRNLVEKWFRSAADILNFLTLWWASAFLSRMFPSNVGLKTMNNIEIQERLAKNLKAIEKATKKLEWIAEESKQASIIEKLAKEIWITQQTINAFAEEWTQWKIRSNAIKWKELNPVKQWQ